MGSSQAKGSNYAWAIAISCIAFYAVPLGFAANHAGLFLTPVINEFGWSQTEASLFMSIQPWVAAICTPFAGKLIAKYNPRWILGTAVLVFGLANLACAWFTAPWQWNVYGVLYGASAAFWMYIATPTMVNRWFAKNNGTVIGAIGVFVSLFGAIMSPIIGGWIATMGWQQARIICSVIVLIAGAGVTFALLRESPEKMGVKPWGYDAAEADRAKSAEAKITEVKETQGLTRAEALKQPALWLLILMAGMFVISASFVQQLARYASTNTLFADGAAVGALAVSVAMVTSMIGKFGLGWISDHFGAKASGVVAGALGAAGAAVALVSGGSEMMFYVGVGLFGIGYSALNVVPPLTCQQAFGDKDYASVFSIVATGLNVFSGFSALIYAQIFDITGSYAGAFWMNIIFYVLIVVLALVIVPMGRRAWAK